MPDYTPDAKGIKQFLQDTLADLIGVYNFNGVEITAVFYGESPVNADKWGLEVVISRAPSSVPSGLHIIQRTYTAVLIQNPVLSNGTYNIEAAINRLSAYPDWIQNIQFLPALTSNNSELNIPDQALVIFKFPVLSKINI